MAWSAGINRLAGEGGLGAGGCALLRFVGTVFRRQVLLLDNRFAVEARGNGIILVRFQRLHAHSRAFHAAGRHFAMSGPNNGIEHDLAEIRVAPIPVVVSAGEAEAAASTFTLGCPGHVLGISLGHVLADRRIATMRAIRATESVLGRQSGEDRRHSLHLGPKPHVVVPLVVDFKRLHAAADRVVGEFLVLSGPVRIDRPVHFKIAADPVQKLVAGLALLDFDAVVNANNADPFLRQRIDRVQMWHHHVPATTIAIHDDAIGPLKDARIFRPAAQRDFRLIFRHRRLELFGQQQAARVVLMRAVAVAGLAGDEDDLFPILGLGSSTAGPLLLVFFLFLFRIAELLDADVLELHGHRRAGVKLQGEQPFRSTTLWIVVDQVHRRDAVELLH